MTNKQIIEEKKKELERCKNTKKALFLQNRTTEEIMYSCVIRKLEKEINELERIIKNEINNKTMENL